MLTHTDRPAECMLCSQFFVNFAELKNHEMTHCHGKSYDMQIPSLVAATSAGLDLTKKKVGHGEEDGVKPTSIKLGFSIDDIMKR